MARSPARLPLMFSPAELAERLGVSRKTILRRIKSGELPVHRLGGQLRISEDDALTYIGARRR